ncbi:MAG: hypothetical protein EBZ77_14550, partial [Chitinophagia bacterium]|nr:hypothetical protein [Chitinophagia bacterium]
MVDLTPAWLHWLADLLQHSTDLTSTELTELIIDDSDPAGPAQAWQLTWQMLQPGTMIIYKSRGQVARSPYFGLTALPESLGRLRALTTLHMRHCSMLPESLGWLPTLTTLDLSGCRALTR